MGRCCSKSLTPRRVPGIILARFRFSGSAPAQGMFRVMFMIGRGERVVQVGPAETHHCPRCEEDKDFIPQLRYSYGQFDLLFGFVYDKRYQLACSQCQHGWKLETNVMEQALGRVPIPFHLRYGLFVAIACAAALVWAAHAYRHPG